MKVIHLLDALLLQPLQLDVGLDLAAAHIERRQPVRLKNMCAPLSYGDLVLEEELDLGHGPPVRLADAKVDVEA